MPRSLRILFRGAYYHFTNRGLAHQQVFTDRGDSTVFLQLVAYCYEMQGVRVLSIACWGRKGDKSNFSQFLLSCLDRDVYFLDGHNNPGFSGGPVVFGQAGRPPTNIAAVISGYKAAPEPVFAGEVDSGLTYRYNTGIVVSYKIEHAITLIKARPIGFSL